MFVVSAVAIMLFFALWWMLVSSGDESPWTPAGLAALVVLLVGFSAREVVMRRAWTRHLLEQDPREHPVREHGPRESTRNKSASNLSASSHHAPTLRHLQRRAIEADAAGAPPESHLAIFHACQDYLSQVDETLRSSGLSSEARVALRAGQEKARSLQKHHMLTWARDESRILTRDAQQRARMSDKIETANRAMDCIDSALKVYPDQPELEESKLAIREFIASVKVAHWVELAERAAFKGHYRRAIERYQDALFYLNRESVKEEVRLAGTERISREIDLLRAHLKTAAIDERDGSSPKSRENT
jgi:tetratricopeptide (TPR) repeat protein